MQLRPLAFNSSKKTGEAKVYASANQENGNSGPYHPR
jgi:hypothetical protein